MFERLTERVRIVMRRAKEEAAGSGQKEVGAEHILLGLLAQPDCLASVALRNLGVDLESLRSDVLAQLTQGGARVSASDVNLSPGGKRALKLASEAARSLGNDYVGTEHLLLGILGESDSTAAQAVIGKGVDVAKAREEIKRLLA